MAPRRKPAARGRGRPRNTRSSTARQANPPPPSPSPPREEEAPQAPPTINLAHVGDVLRDFTAGFLASLAQAMPPQPGPIPPTAEESEHIVTPRYGPTNPTSPQAPPQVTPVINVLDTYQYEMEYQALKVISLFSTPVLVSYLTPVHRIHLLHHAWFHA